MGSGEVAEMLGGFYWMNPVARVCLKYVFCLWPFLVLPAVLAAMG